MDSDMSGQQANLSTRILNQVDPTKDTHRNGTPPEYLAFPLPPAYAKRGKM
jgi:hypothetical protein